MPPLGLNNLKKQHKDAAQAASHASSTLTHGNPRREQQNQTLQANASSNIDKSTLSINHSPGGRKKANRESILNQTEPLLQEKDDDEKAAQVKLMHQNTMPKVVEKDGDGEEESPQPADNAINKT